MTSTTSENSDYPRLDMMRKVSHRTGSGHGKNQGRTHTYKMSFISDIWSRHKSTLGYT